MLGERLCAKRGLAEDDLADRLVDDLLEAGHVGTLLETAEVDEAVQACMEELVPDPDDLLDAPDADPGQAHGDSRRAGLDVDVAAHGDLRGDRTESTHAGPA